MFMIKKTHLFITALVVFFAGYANPVKASLLDLSHDPLFLDQSVPPAIAVTLDDSGSMAWGYMYRGDFNNVWNRFADPAFNQIYYNPNINYAPPIRADGSQMPNIDYTNAPVNGYFEFGYGKWFSVNLTNNYRPLSVISYNRDGTFGGNWAGAIPAATNDGRGTRAFYLVQQSDGTYDEVQITNADELTNFANWYSYYNTRMKLARASISRAFAGFGPSFKLDWQALHFDTTLNNLTKFENTHRNGFYQWLFTAPTQGGTPLRSAFYRATELFEKTSSYRSDDFNDDLSCQQNFHIAISDGGWNGGFGNTVLRDENGQGLPGDTDNLYGNYTGTGEQAIFSKSENQSSLSDIAFDSWARDLNSDLDNNVKRFKKDFRDSTGNIIDFSGVDDQWENNAFVWNPKNNPAYWQHLVTFNIGMGIESTRVREYESGNYGTNAIDTLCPFQATITDSREAVYLGLRQGKCDWPNATNTEVRIDDVWHSSINSRGQFISANDPEQLINALNDVVNDILERLARGASSSFSSGVITDNTRVYSPGFDSSTWSGNLIAREINADRSFGDAVWDASCILTGGLCNATGEVVPKQLLRKVFTYNPVSKTRERFDSTLSTVLKSVISLNADEMLTDFNINVQDIIDYVLGDQSKEQNNSGSLKNRVSVLADIVHSSPYIVRGPSAAYEDSEWANGTPERAAADADNGYLDFQIDQKDRNNSIYVGSNGGMLHAFNAAGADEGKERWAYMPSKTLNNIHRLANPTEEHWSYVDNTPVVRDAFINGNWRSVLVGGMRYGGQSFYALDVTDGDSTEAEVLWEFSDTNDADMGFSYGEATIVRISSTGDWVALLPNGYNNTEPDFKDSTDPRNRISASGNAVLFVVRLRDGQLLAKIDTGIGTVNTPNGLASVVTVDSEYQIPPGESDAQVDYGVDFAYAGDLYGNFYRFDFTDPTYSNWSAKRLVKANAVKERPITVKPRVIAVPDGIQSMENDVIVMYATGKYLEPSDRSTNLPAKQYIVGLIDGLTSTNEDLNIEDNSFVEQDFSAAGIDSGGGSNLRSLSSNDVNHAVDNGWKVELPENGERVFNPLSLIGRDALFVVSNVTAGIDPCEAGGRSWLMAINPLTGGLPKVGEIFSNITVNVNGVPETIFDRGAGLLIQDFVIGSPAFTESPGGGTLDVNVEGVNEVITTSIQKFTWRRRNWTNLLTE
jgi:type IV pilus assembly protein PilY1